MKRIILLVLLIFQLTLAYSQQFRLVGNPSGFATTVNDSTYTLSVLFPSDQTGNGFLPTQIPTDGSYRMFFQDEKIYRITGVTNVTFSSADLTLVEYRLTEGIPTGQGIVFDPLGRETVPSVPSNAIGASPLLFAAIATYNIGFTAGNYVETDPQFTATLPSLVLQNEIAVFDTTWQTNGGQDITAAYLVSKLAAYQKVKIDLELTDPSTSNLIVSLPSPVNYENREIELFSTNTSFTHSIVVTGIYQNDNYIIPDGDLVVLEASLANGELRWVFKNKDNVGSGGGKQLNFANVDSLISYGRVIETGSRLYLDNGAEYVVVNSNPTPVGQLFIEVDSFAMIPLSDGKLAVMDNEVMNLSWFGIVAGETEDFDLMRTNQKRLINAVAWHDFKRSQLFIDGYYRIYSGIPKTTRFIQSCNIKGESPRASVLDFFPKTNDYLSEATDLFTINQPGKDNHRFEGFAMFGDSLGFKQQTYTAILQSGGDPNTIEIRDTNQVWPGLWSNLIVGDTIFYERDITNTASKTGHWSTIASFDSVNRLIVLNDAVIGTEATTNTRIGIRWPRDTIINPDTILAYSKNWTFRDDNFDGYKFLLINHQEDPKPWGHQVIMENLHMDGFTTPIGFSRSLPVLRINNVAVGGRLIAMTFFNNEVPETPEYVLDAFNLTILPSATKTDGGVGYGGNDGVYGSGIYSHTSVPARIINSTFYSAKGSPSLRFFSSKPTNSQSFTVIENCTFKSGAWLFTSDRMTTKVTNSWFVDSRISSYNDIEFIDCRFDSTNVVMSANWDKDEGRIRYITLKGIKSDNSRFEISHSNYVDRIVTNVQILDSEFYIVDQTPISITTAGAIGNADGYTLIRGCTYKFVDGLQSFTPPNTSGANSGSGFVTASGRVVIDNLQRIGGRETYNASFINQADQYYKVSVKNSDLSAWQSLKGDTGFNPRNALELIDSPINGHQLGASELVYTLDARKPTTGRIRNHDLRNADAGNLGSKVIPQTAVIENDGNDVVLDVNGFDTLSNIHTRWFNLLNPNGNFNNGDVSGWTNVTYRISPSDTLRLKRQTASNPNSNIIAAQDIDLYPNQSYEFQSIPFTPVGSYDSIRVITDAIITTNGTDSIYNSGNGGDWEDGNGTRFIHFPSGFTLQSSAGWTCPIQADGTVDCDEVQGYVSNYRRRWNLILSSLPPASEIISVTGRAMFDPYQFGAFKLIGEEAVKVINPLGGEDNVQASLDSLKSAIDDVYFTETIILSAGVSNSPVTLPAELQGSTLYQCQCNVNSSTIPSPSVDQMTVYVLNKTTTDFEVYVGAAPGAGESTTIECALYKK